MINFSLVVKKIGVTIYIFQCVLTTLDVNIAFIFIRYFLKNSLSRSAVHFHLWIHFISPPFNLDLWYPVFESFWRICDIAMPKRLCWIFSWGQELVCCQCWRWILLLWRLQIIPFCIWSWKTLHFYVYGGWWKIAYWFLIRIDLFLFWWCHFNLY